MRFTGAVCCLLLGSLVGCGRKPPEPPPARPPEVGVAVAKLEKVTDYEDFSGRTEPYRAVEVKARATGYLDDVFFTDGAWVEEGDILFQIDVRTYAAEKAKTEFMLRQAEARLNRIKKDFARAKTLVPGVGISQEEFDRISSELAEAGYNLKIAEANATIARINWEFTTVTAPLSGRISRRFIDPGNLIKADETLLTTIVALDPMYAVFDVDERTVLKLRRLAAKQEGMPFEMALADEEKFTHKGTVHFTDNRIDSGTGTLRLRGQFDNPKLLFSPGLFVRVRLQIGEPRMAVAIPERALVTDQGQRFIYVVDKNDTVSYRAIEIGAQHNGLRVITKGLSEGERVVVSGIQRLRAGMKVVWK